MLFFLSGSPPEPLLQSSHRGANHTAELLGWLLPRSRTKTVRFRQPLMRSHGIGGSTHRRRPADHVMTHAITRNAKLNYEKTFGALPLCPDVANLCKFGMPQKQRGRHKSSWGLVVCLYVCIWCALDELSVPQCMKLTHKPCRLELRATYS
jgi:hypothetical protein